MGQIYFFYEYEEKIQKPTPENNQESQADILPETYTKARTQEINQQINSYQGPKNSVDLVSKTKEIQENYKQYMEESDAEGSQETLQLFQKKMQAEIDFYKKEFDKFNDLQRLETVSNILKPEDFQLYEKILGNKEGNTDDLFDSRGKVIHATNSTALDIISDVNTISGGTRQLGPSFSDGDHDIAITFNLVWEKLKTPGGIDKTHKKIDLDEYPQFPSKYNEFVDWAVQRLKNEYGEGEKFEMEKNKLLAKAEKHNEDKSVLHDTEEQYTQELKDMAYGTLKPKWIKDGLSEEEAENKVKEYIENQNHFKNRLKNRPQNEVAFPVTLAFIKNELPELVPEGGEREFELRTEEEIKLDNASTIFVPEKYLNSRLVRKINQVYPNIDIRTEEELEFVRMNKLLNKINLP